MIDDITASRFEDWEVRAGRWVKGLLKYPGKTPELNKQPSEYLPTTHFRGIIGITFCEMWRKAKVKNTLGICSLIGNCFNIAKTWRNTGERKQILELKLRN